jgi:predicted acylesterase/phospholipase RssA
MTEPSPPTVSEPTDNPIIKHLVISGGGAAGFSFYGALRESNKKQVWSMQNIETIHGTSVGSMMAVMISLGYDWDTLDDYLIKRPWHMVYKFNLYSFMDGLSKRGIFDKKVMEETLGPLLSGKDMSVDITMQEYYEKTNVELHIHTTEMNKFESIDISYKTHPDWKLVDAVYASSSLPVIFAPLITDGNCFCDGGFMMNYPIPACIRNGANPKEIMGISRVTDVNNRIAIEENSSILEYGIMLVYRIMERLLTPPKYTDIGLEYKITSPRLSLNDIIETAASQDERIRLIDNGAKYVN